MASTTDAAGTPVSSNWGWFFALGILMMVGGTCAIFAPFLISILVEWIAGIFFVLGGGMMLIQVFTTKDGWNARLTYLILGAFTTLAGLLLIFRPLEGLLALTLVLIGALFVSGLLRIMVGVMARPEPGSGWILFSGCLSVLLSGAMIASYPQISIVLLGTLVGVSMIGEGAGYVRFAYGLKTLADAKD